MNSGEGACECSHGAFLTPVIWAVLSAVHKKRSVVSLAVRTTVSFDLWLVQVRSQGLWRRPEVIDRARLVGYDGAIGDQDTVNTNALSREWQEQRVVADVIRIGILECV